jgi:hypothetical protein
LKGTALGGQFPSKPNAAYRREGRASVERTRERFCGCAVLRQCSSAMWQLLWQLHGGSSSRRRRVYSGTTVSQAVGHGFAPRADAEFGEDRLQVMLDPAGCDAESGTDVLVAEAFGEGAQHLEFAIGEVGVVTARHHLLLRLFAVRRPFTTRAGVRQHRGPHHREPPHHAMRRGDHVVGGRRRAATRPRCRGRVEPPGDSRPDRAGRSSAAGVPTARRRAAIRSRTPRVRRVDVVRAGPARVAASRSPEGKVTEMSSVRVTVASVVTITPSRQ